MTEKPAKPAASKPTSSRKPNTRPAGENRWRRRWPASIRHHARLFFFAKRQTERSSLPTSLMRNCQSAPSLSQPQARKQPLS